MSAIAIELLFKQHDDTPLEIDAREIEIVSSVQEDGLHHFGVGSRFRYHDREYKVLDLDVHYLQLDHDGTVGEHSTPLSEEFFVRVVYKVEPQLF